MLIKFLVAFFIAVSLSFPVQANHTVTEIMDSTVKISDYKGGEGSGTVVYSKETKRGVLTYILTNQHVIQNNVDDLVMITRYGKTIDYQEAKVVAKSYPFDLALLRVHNVRHKAPYVWPYATFNNTEQPPGTPVLIVGFPLGQGPLPTEGLLSRTDYFNEGPKLTLSSAPAIYGNSGGGLYVKGETGWELYGILRGVGSAPLSVYQTELPLGQPVGIFHFPVVQMSYSIPIESIKTFLIKSNYEWIIND